MSRFAIVVIVVCLVGRQGAEATRFTWSSRDFEVTRALLAGGDVEVTVAGGGELVPLIIRIGGPQRLRISRAAHVVWGLWELGRVKSLADGRAVSAFRERVGEYERALIAGRPATEAEPEACGFLLAGALVSALGGDPAAGSRARDLVMQRLRAGPVGAPDAAPCVAGWDGEVGKADASRAKCLATADSRDGWSERAAERTLCEADFVAAFTIAEARRAACRSGESPRQVRKTGGF